MLEDGQPVRQEYKFHVSGGRIAYIFVARRMDDGSKRFCHLGRDGRLAPFQKDDASTQGEIEIPATFDRLAAIAERLAAPFDYMRCDFYERDGEIFFSELTPYPQSGYSTGMPYLDNARNAGWDLRKSWFLTNPQRGWRRAYSAALRRWLDGAFRDACFVNAPLCADAASTPSAFSGVFGRRGIRAVSHS